jgi:putative chitinase
MTALQLASITRQPVSEMERWVLPLTQVFERFAINTQRRKEFFLAQVAFETAGFTRLEENFRYSRQRLLEVFPKYFTPAIAAQYAVNPQAIANRVYANRMGNGNEASGDGWRYRGRGLKHLTGKWNYEQCARDLGIDIVESPDLLLEPDYAALSAAWFWDRNKLNAIADKNDFSLLTRRINGGVNGLKNREIFLQRAKAHKL